MPNLDFSYLQKRKNVLFSIFTIREMFRIFFIITFPTSINRPLLKQLFLHNITRYYVFQHLPHNTFYIDEEILSIVTF